MLVELLTAKMKENKLSIRAAARKIGVSHTTIVRVLKGDQVDMNTLVAIANWLNVSPSVVLGSQGKSDKSLSDKIASVLISEPKLREIFEETIDRIEKGEVSSELISEIVSYIKFKIDLELIRKK